MLRTVYLYGRLGEEFGREHRLDIETPGEAVRALSYLYPGFASHIRENRYAVTAGRSSRIDECVSYDDPALLELGLGKRTTVHIAPEGVVAGIETIILVGVLALTAVAALATVLLMKAPKPQEREEATKVESAMFDGPDNSIEQGHPVPLVYGEMLVGSIVASSGLLIADLAGGTGDPPGGKSDGDGSDGVGTPGTVGSTPAYLGEETPVEFQNNDGLIVYGGGGGKAGGDQDPPTEAPNNLQSAATARVLEIISEGEIVGLVDGLKSVYLDDTVLQNPDGSFNFQGVHVEQRLGLPDQDYIQGFGQAENTVDVSTQLKVLVGPITRTITNPDATMARVAIRVPALMQTNNETGDITGSKVVVGIAVQADGGGYSTVYTMTIQGKTNSGYERSVQFPLPPGAVRDIRVTRVTPDSTSSSLQNDTYWATLTEVVEAKLSYPDTALIALTVDARQFGTSIPSRAYLIRGLIIEVPSNYDPLTRVYTGVWDGTFVRKWTNNPAWIIRDLIVNRRYGLGARVPETALDKWSLYAIAQYCDELVPDGQGGTQPRYTLNTVIKTATQAYDLLATVAGAFRGLVYWASGAIRFAQDRPEDPSILLTPANVVDGKFRYGRATAHDRRRSVAVVYWNNPADFYKLNPAIYEDPELIRRFGRRTGQEVVAFGVTNEGEAIRKAKWILEDEKPSSNATVQYGVGDDHSFVEPGRIATIADPMFAGVRRGGRVRTSAANSVTIDRPFNFVAGQVYTLRVMLPDGTVRVRGVTNAAGETDVVTLDGAAFAANPNPGAIWTIESATVANRQFRIRAIETDEPPYDVRALAHDPTKYARVELEQDLEPPDYMDLPTGPLGLPFDLGVTEFLLGDGTAAIPSALFGWSPPSDPRVVNFDAQYRLAGEEWIDLGTSSLASRTVRGIAPGNYEFRVRGLDALGRRTAWVAGTGLMDGQADGMPEVVAPGVVVNEGLFSVKLTWFEPVDSRPLRYEVLYDVAGVYANAVSLGTTDRLEYTITEAGTYWVRTAFMSFRSPAPTAIPVSALVFSAGIVPHLTKDAALVPALADGTVVSYDGAAGEVKVYSGTTDVSTDFSLSIPVGGNPQGLTVNLVGRTYTVTAGLDPGENEGTVVLRATGSGDYTGVVLDKVFTVAKAKQGVGGYFRDIKFKRSQGQPATPTLASPPDWADGIPAGTDAVWSSSALKRADGTLVGAWTTPALLSPLVQRGPYSGSATYYLNDVVQYNGSSYIATQNNFTGQAPSGTGESNGYWDVFASQGAPGEPGDPPAGFSATIDVPTGTGGNLKSLAVAAGYTNASDATITFEIESGVTATGLQMGTWLFGDYTITLTLAVKAGGKLYGLPGSAGAGGDGLPGGNGGNGGDAFSATGPITITHEATAEIKGGGGGGGGGGGSARLFGPPGEEELQTAAGGSGGTGFPSQTAGSAGTLPGGAGGGGGAAAAGGTSGDSGSGSTGGTYPWTNYGGGTGGAAGYAIRKNGHTVPVSGSGTVTGTVG